MTTSTNNLGWWHLPQRQSPAAIFIIFGRTSLKLLKVFWPVLVLYFLKDETESNAFVPFWMVAGFGFFSIVGTIISYWFKKFYIKEQNLIIKTGWLKKKTLSIPFQNIQAVHLEQNVWQQALHVVNVTFDATGSEKVEVQLDALSIEKAEDLKNLLTDNGQGRTGSQFDESVKSSTYKLSFPDLIKLSLTANHLEAFFILLGLGFNALEEIQRVFDFDGQEYFNSYSQEMAIQAAYAILVLFLGVVILSLIYSIARTLINFYGFTLVETRKDWKISFGLFNKQQKTIPLNKIQILSWSATWLRKKFDYWIIKVQAVGHSRKNRKQHAQVPIVAFSQVLKLVNSYQEFSGIDPYKSCKVAPEFWKRRVFMISLPITLIPMVVSWYWISWWALSFLLLFVYLSVYYYKAFQNFRWQTLESGIQLLSGVWGRKFRVLNWKKVQQINIRQTLYQRRRHLADVIFLTAGGKVILPYITLSTATALVDRVLYDVESKNEDWI